MVYKHLVRQGMDNTLPEMPETGEPVPLPRPSRPATAAITPEDTIMVLSTLRENSQWVLLWLLFLAVSLYARPPIPVDETRYLSVAWEMWRSGHFLVPHINGEPYSHKPPLLFWLIHLVWWLFGVHEWTARLVPPLFGLGAIFLAQGLAIRLWPREPAVRNLVPFFLLGSFFWALFSTLTMFDMLVAFFSLLALHGLLLAQAVGRALVGWSLFALALALGMLAKGPVILVYVAGPALLAPLWQEGQETAWPAWYSGFLASVAVAAGLVLCWAVPAARAGGQEYGQAILFGQTAGRMVQSFAHQRAFWWYLAVLPLLMLPWTVCGCLWQGLGRVLAARSPAVRFCLAVLVPAFLALSLVSGKQVHYLLPLLPVFFLLLGRGLTLSAGGRGRGLVPLVLSFLLLGVTLPALPLLLRGGDGALLTRGPGWLGLGPLLAALVLWSCRHAGPAAQVRTIATVSVLLLVFFQLALRAPLRQLFDAGSIPARMRRVQERGHDIAVYPPRFADQFQFAGRLLGPLVRQPILPKELVWAYHNKDGYCLIFIEEKKDLWLLEGKGVARRYNRGWLIFRPARGLYDEYLAMEQKRKRSSRGQGP